MLFQRTNNRSYSLVELLVVIGVVTTIGITSIPNLFNRNDRLLLDSSANQLRQVMIEATTRAQAPDKNDSSGSPQVFQVSFGKFTKDATTTGVAVGDATTNTIALERGLVQCDTGDLQGGFTTLRSFTLPRGIYLSSFYPSNQTASDDRAVIRFAVGDNGFSCGSYNKPVYKSGQLFLGDWLGVDKANSLTVARYLVVELASQKVGDKRFVTLDRVTHQVAVTRSNPQSYFTPVVDKLAPKWNDVDLNNFTMSVACGSPESSIIINFPRAKDRVNDLDKVDANLFVAYNINWKVGGVDQPLAINYFYDLALSTIRFQFITDLFTVANQPKKLVVTVAAVDGLGKIQPAYDAAALDPANLLNQRQKAFVATCGSVISDPDPDPDPPDKPIDPPGDTEACNPISNIKPNLTRRITQVLIGRSVAARPSCLP